MLNDEMRVKLADAKLVAPFQFWNAFSRWIKTLSKIPANQDCRDWLSMCGLINAGKTLSIEKAEKFDKWTSKWVVEYFKQESINVVVTTSNNSADAKMRQGMGNFDLIVVDEAGFAHERDAMVAVSTAFASDKSKNMARIHLVGDHWQLQPESQKGFNEHALQDEISWFYRLAQNPSMSVQSLRVNYRMHPRITQFPGSMPSYGGLVSDPSTEVLSEAARLWSL
jgi:superfamily I DNA and/or RNA helicase